MTFSSLTSNAPVAVRQATDSGARGAAQRRRLRRERDRGAAARLLARHDGAATGRDDLGPHLVEKHPRDVGTAGAIARANGRFDHDPVS